MTISTLVPRVSPPRISLNGYVLPINPQSLDETVTQIVVIVQVLDGVARTDYGAGLREWSMSGTTGQGGRAAALAIRALGPQGPGRVRPAVTFRCPFMYGSQSFQVHVDSVNLSERGGADALLYSYDIRLREASAAGLKKPRPLSAGR